MKTIQPGAQVVSMAPNGEAIEVYTVVKVLADGVQVDGTSGRLSRAELRLYNEDTVNRIRQKENQLNAIKQEMMSLYRGLDALG